MWKCKYCQEEYNFTTTPEKANHTRWCRHNPKRNVWNKHQAGINKYGEFKNFNVLCGTCNKKFVIKEREYLYPQKEKYFCSRSCANIRNHSKETREKISDSINRYFQKNNRKRKRKRKRIFYNKECKHCGKKFKTQNKTRHCCSGSCSAHFRNRFKREQKTDFANYRSDCKFKFNLKDYPDEFDFALIETHGWYKAKNRGNNLGGVSRDHIISVRYGFDNDIDPSIISHPANCQLLKHSDNVSKYIKNGLTLEELLDKIERWDEKYK